MDPEAAVIDVGRLGPQSAGQSIIYLTGSEVRAYHLAGTTQPTPTTLLKIPTLTVFPEPADLPQLPLMRDWKGTGQPAGHSAIRPIDVYPITQAGVQGPGES